MNFILRTLVSLFFTAIGYAIVSVALSLSWTWVVLPTTDLPRLEFYHFFILILLVRAITNQTDYKMMELDVDEALAIGFASVLSTAIRVIGLSFAIKVLLGI